MRFFLSRPLVALSLVVTVGAGCGSPPEAPDRAASPAPADSSPSVASSPDVSTSAQLTTDESPTVPSTADERNPPIDVLLQLRKAVGETNLYREADREVIEKDIRLLAEEADAIQLVRVEKVSVESQRLSLAGVPDSEEGIALSVAVDYAIEESFREVSAAGPQRVLIGVGIFAGSRSAEGQQEAEAVLNLIPVGSQILVFSRIMKETGQRVFVDLQGVIFVARDGTLVPIEPELADKTGLGEIPTLGEARNELYQL